MDDSGPISMTGSDAGAPHTHRSSVSIALGQLRRMVASCCLLVVLALVVQLVAWSWANWGGGRTVRLESSAPAPLVVEGEPGVTAELTTLDPLGENVDPPQAVADPNLVRAPMDRTIELAAELAAAIGRLATAALVPLVALGVLLAAGSATDGVEKTVTAFAWSIVVAFLVFPIASRFGMPWSEGALWNYNSLTAILDGEGGRSKDFWLQYAAVPFATLCAAVVAGSRFTAGVRAGLMRREDFALDPALEREAGGRRAGSLHGSGSRTARAMDAVSAPAGAPSSEPASTAPVGTIVPGVQLPPSPADDAPPLRPTGTDGPAVGGDGSTPPDGEVPRRLI